jgi:hypothetical protein
MADSNKKIRLRPKLAQRVVAKRFKQPPAFFSSPGCRPKRGLIPPTRICINYDSDFGKDFFVDFFVGRIFRRAEQRPSLRSRRRQFARERPSRRAFGAPQDEAVGSYSALNMLPSTIVNFYLLKQHGDSSRVVHDARAAELPTPQSLFQ